MLQLYRAEFAQLCCVVHFLETTIKMGEVFLLNAYVMFLLSNGVITGEWDFYLCAVVVFLAFL